MPTGNYNPEQEARWHEQRLRGLETHLRALSHGERQRVLQAWELNGKASLAQELRLRMAASRPPQDTRR